MLRAAYGTTWTRLDPAEGLLIVTAALSPSFGSDKTLFVGAATARPNALGSNSTANVDSAGILVSRDAGATWASLSDGLQTEDGPFQQVLGIGISPNFSNDQTLLVTSIGPKLPPVRPGTCRRAVSTARWMVAPRGACCCRQATGSRPGFRLTWSSARRFCPTWCSEGA